MFALVGASLKPCRACASFWPLQLSGKSFGDHPQNDNIKTYGTAKGILVKRLPYLYVRHVTDVSTIGTPQAHCLSFLPVNAVSAISTIHYKYKFPHHMHHAHHHVPSKSGYALLCRKLIHTHSEPVTKNEISSDGKDDISVSQSINIPLQSSSSESTELGLGTTDHNVTLPVSGRKSKRKPVLDYDWIKPEGLDTGIKVYNSLTRKKEPLILPAGRLATWYACGPTVYDHAHIGHASSYVRTDIIRRIMMNFFNIDVVFVMGITDIDDKIINRSRETGVDFRHLSRHFESEFFKEMDSLKVLAPTVKTRVSDHIPQIIGFTQRIIDNGYAYTTPDGTVYFDVNKYGRYGKLHPHGSEELLQGGIRVPVDTGKSSPRDFALWKAAKPDEPCWKSPWGKGRPGWHIECSTMASTIFGSKLDIHSGGDDLRFPHHENEMAQSQACFSSKQWTNYWLHTGFLHQRNEKTKMSKSLKNTIRLTDLLKSYTPNQFRLFSMLRPYRQLIEYNEESMEKAVHIHDQWASFQTVAHTYVHGQYLCEPIDDVYLLESLEQTKKKIELALADDFDTPKAVAALEELVSKTNIQLSHSVKTEAESGVRSPGVIAAVAAYVDRIMDLFGVQVSRKKKLSQTGTDDKFTTVMDSVVKFRGDIRQFALNPEMPSPPAEFTETQTKKHLQQQMKPLFSACDRLRDDLKVVGIQMQDHVKESSWDVVEQTRIPPAKKKES